MVGIEKLVWGGPESVWYWHFFGVLTGLWCGCTEGAAIGASFPLFGVVAGKGRASEISGSIGLLTGVIAGTVCGFWVGTLMGGWMLLTFLLALVPLWRLPEELPETSPLDRLMISVQIDKAFGTPVGSAVVNMRVLMTMVCGLAGGVIGGLLWAHGEAVVIGALSFGIAGRLLSFGILMTVGRLAERRLTERHAV